MNKADERPLAHLQIIFEEVLPALVAENVRYWVFGGVAIAGVASRVLRSGENRNGDVDIYVCEADFNKAERIVRKLAEQHGDWDADRWVVTYSMMKGTGRPKVELYVKKYQLFSVVPVYPTEEGVEFRVITSTSLPINALEQEQHELEGFKFFTPPVAVLKAIFRSFILERLETKDYIIAHGTKRRVDAESLFDSLELEEFDERANVALQTVGAE
ncbi:MAG: hypothetical protein WC030_01840 [Candidatus Paceibacterota bacterium]